MNQIKNLANLESLSYFDKTTLKQFCDLSDNSLYANIKRWLKTGRIIQLKKGLYVTGNYFRGISDKKAYTEFIANKLREPSYLSMEYVLQKYGILTEAIYSVTNVTLKSSRTYRNQFGTFIYQTIKGELFTGFEINAYGGFEIKEATKAKALFDFFYFKTYRVESIDEELLESLRLNLGELNRQDFGEFARYCELSGINKYAKLSKLLGALNAIQRTRENRSRRKR